MAFTDNIKEITPAITQLKSNTPVIVIDGKIYVAGIGGNFIPGNAAASQSGTANIAAGYITISDSVITVHNVTDGTTSTTDKLYIADTGVEEPQYQSGGTIPVQEFKVYKCTATSDSTWTGYQYDIDTPGLDAVQSTMQFKLATAPTVGAYYNEDATVQVKPYATRSDLVVYVPMVKSASIDQLGTSLRSNAVNFTNVDGLDCCQFSGNSNCYIASSYRGITGSMPWSWSIWCKQNYRDQNSQMVFQYGTYAQKQCLGLQILSSGVYYAQETGIQSATSYDTYKWHNIATIYNGATFNVYIDGQLIGQSDLVLNIDYSGSEGFQVGRSTASNWWIPFNGYIRDLKLYNRPLTPQEVAAEYSRLSSKIINS